MCPVDPTILDEVTQCDPSLSCEGPQTLEVPLHLAHCVVVPWPISPSSSRTQEGNLRGFLS
ncbi:hypothetical protein I79_015754 [Cricetulus griseus]|uniref:Uncharacterized protein n=1 Tax=Cricetulus griseus TaxID=10029 RepID=G3HXM6_CRIGR|nr:hypothetical protein I79_015754 [Cricetulus griseus]